MATIGPIGDAPKGTSIFSATTKPTKTTSNPTDQLGKDEFMKLLMAQLQNQDPMNPMDDQAFIAQIAQFNTLDQMTTLNKAVSSLLVAQQLAEASGLIGKVVRALDATGAEVIGEVTAASMADGKAVLHLGDTKVSLDKVTAVAPDDSSLPSASES